MGDDGYVTAQANAHAAGVLAQALVPADAPSGPRHVVATPGSRHTPLLLAFAAQPQLRVHMVLDERAAGFVALGLAKVTGQASILCCTSGSAAAHFLPAIVEASASQVPLVVLSADRPAELHGCGAPQTMPQDHLFSAYVRRQLTLPLAEPGSLAATVGAWRVQTARALAVAEQQACGPVHLNVPFREPLWQKPRASGAHPAPPISPAVRIFAAPRGIDAAPADRLAACMQQAQRGLIVVGPLKADAASRQDAQAILALAQRLGWPCVVDGCSQLRFAAAAPASKTGFCLVTTADALLRQPAFRRVLRPPDVIVRFGQLPTSKTLWSWLGQVGADAGTTSVLVDGAGDWADPAHIGDMLLVVRAAQLCPALLPRLVDPADASAWARLWQRGQAAAQHTIAEVLTDPALDTAPLTEAFVAHALCRALGPGALLHVASSMPIRDIESFGQSSADSAAPALGPHISCSRGVNGIDGTLATVLGLALARPEGAVVGLMGDLAFLHDVASLQLARQLQVRAVAIVVNNAGGDIFAHLPVAALEAQDLPSGAHSTPTPFDTYFRTPQKADIGALCRAAHVGFCQVSSCEAFRAALRQTGIVACTAHTPHNAGLVVIEVVIDAAHSRRGRDRVHEAVARGLSAVEDTGDRA